MESQRLYYHNIGMAATNRICLFNVPCSQYIDDRHVGQLRLHQSSHSQWSNLQLAQAGGYIACTILVSLGYFICLNKCVILPPKIVRFLGFLCDSDLQVFVLPEDKKEKFANLRESVLSQHSVSVKSLQRLAGKIISFCIAVPAAKLYALEIYRATVPLRNKRPKIYAKYVYAYAYIRVCVFVYARILCVRVCSLVCIS